MSTYTITVTQGSNGTISPSTTTVTGGQSKTFTITPNSGYKVSKVLVDGKSVGAVTSYTFSNVTSNHTISATFKLDVSITIDSLSSDEWLSTITITVKATVTTGGNINYTLYVDNSSKATTTGASGSEVDLTVTGLSKGTTYKCYVVATSASDSSISDTSSTISVTTYSCNGSGYSNCLGVYSIGEMGQCSACNGDGSCNLTNSTVYLETEDIDCPECGAEKDARRWVEVCAYDSNCEYYKVEEECTSLDLPRCHYEMYDDSKAYHTGNCPECGGSGEREYMYYYCETHNDVYLGVNPSKSHCEHGRLYMH